MAQPKFLEEEITFSGKFSRQVFETIGKSFGPFKARVVTLLIVGIIGRFLLLFSANTIGYWADSLCRAPAVCKSIPNFFIGFSHHDFVGMLSLLAGLGFLLNSIFRVGISRTGALAVSILYDEVTLRTSRLPMGFFDTTPVGRIISRFSSDYGAIFRMAGGPLGEFLCLVFDLFLMIALTTFASVYFTPVVIGVVTLNYLTYRASNVQLRRERRTLSHIRGPAIAHFAETVQGSCAVKVFGKRPTFLHRFETLLHEFLHQRVRTAIAIHVFSFKMTGITAGLFLITGLAGIWLNHLGLVSVGSLAVAFTFIMMTSTTIQQFFEWLANLEEALTGIERMDNYLRRPMEPGARLPPSSQFNFGEPRSLAHSVAMPTRSLPPVIKVTNLSFRYRSDLPMIFENLNFTVHPKEHLAIIGRTGSGKTSLIQVLFSMYPIMSGNVTIDGMSADLTATNSDREELKRQKLLPLSEFRRFMALIPQEPTLFRGTLRENLTRNADQSDHELRAALEKMGLSSWLTTLTDRAADPLTLKLEEAGSNLSLGERQLLCMARALLQKTSIIIMDEATSSIDPASEQLLLHATQTLMKDKTRIVIAHRLSTIENADRVLWLERGRIKMLDSPSKVLPIFRNEAPASAPL